MNENVLRTGVYSIVNIVTGKVYVGSAAKSFRLRWNQHRSELRRGIHKNSHLQHAWTRYGEESFSFNILVLCCPEECVRYEQRMIDGYDAVNPDHGYNILPTAGSLLGHKQSAETKAKKSRALTGRVISPETRRKLSEANRGKSQSPESRAKNSASNKGKVFSAETRLKLSEAMRGRTYSTETIARMSAAKRGVKATPEACAANAAAQLGRRHSAETKAKIAAGNRGKIVGQETRDKIAAARRGTTISQEHRAILLDWARRPRKPLSAEHRLKLSVAAKRRHSAVS